MFDVNTFRDYPTCTSIFTEHDRVLESRRCIVQELQQSVNALEVENNSLEEQLRSESLRYEQRKNIQDEKLREKDAKIRSQQERLEQFILDEQRFQDSLRKCEENIQAATEELERRNQLGIRLQEAKQRLTEIKLNLEQSEESLTKLENRIAREEMITEKRHTAFANSVSRPSLPRIDDTSKRSGLEDIAGDSILLPLKVCLSLGFESISLHLRPCGSENNSYSPAVSFFRCLDYFRKLSFLENEWPQGAAFLGKEYPTTCGMVNVTNWTEPSHILSERPIITEWAYQKSNSSSVNSAGRSMAGSRYSSKAREGTNGHAFDMYALGWIVLLMLLIMLLFINVMFWIKYRRVKHNIQDRSQDFLRREGYKGGRLAEPTSFSRKASITTAPFCGTFREEIEVPVTFGHFTTDNGVLSPGLNKYDLSRIESFAPFGTSTK